MNTGDRPSEKITVLATTTAGPEEPPTWVSTTKPAAAMTRPTAIMVAGRTRRAIIGDTMDPTTNPTANGIDHRPAASGESPSTNCRYWAMKT